MPAPSKNSSKPMMQDEMAAPIVAPDANWTTRSAPGGVRPALSSAPAADEAPTRRTRSRSRWGRPRDVGRRGVAVAGRFGAAARSGGGRKRGEEGQGV